MSSLIMKRLFAYLIDMVILSIPTYVYLIYFWDSFLTEGADSLLGITLYLQLIPFVLYFFISEFFFFATIGKYVMKLKVIYQKPHFNSIFIRTFCRFIPLELLSFIFFGDELLHDKLSKTRVVPPQS